MLLFALPEGLVASWIAFVVQASISGGITLASYAIAAVAGILAIAGAIYGIRWKTAYEVERATRESIDERASVLAHERDDTTRKLEESTRALTRANETIARLEALPNLERVLQLVNGSFDRFLERQEEMHRENVTVGEQRTERILGAIRGEKAA